MRSIYTEAASVDRMSVDSSIGSSVALYAALFTIILYVGSVHNVLFSIMPTIKPLYWFVVTVGLACVIGLARSEEVIRGLPSVLVLWLLVYLAQLIITFMYSSQSVIAEDQFIKGLQTVALFAACNGMFSACSGNKMIPTVLVVIVLFATLVNSYDFIFERFSTVAGRAAGFYGNPNTAGKTIALTMVLGCVALPSKFRFLFCAIAGFAVLLTFSRSSWLLWAVAIIGLAATGNLSLKSKSFAVMIFGGTGLVLLYALMSGAALDFFYVTGLDRYLTDNTLARIGGSGSAFEDSSTVARLNMIKVGFMAFGENPWFGAGLGASSEWLTIDRPHNLFLLIAVESGMFGLLIFLGLLIGIWRNVDSVGRVALLVYAVSCLFAHTNLEQAGFLCLIALIATERRPRSMREVRSV